METEATILPAGFLTLPLISLLLIVSAGVLLWVADSPSARGRRRHPQRRQVLRSTYAWLAVYAVAELALAVLCGMGAVTADPISFCVCSFVLLLCGASTLLRRPVLRRMRRLDERDARGRAIAEGLRAARDVVVLIASCAVSFFALEAPWNHTWPTINPAYSGIEVLFIAGVIISLYFLAQRRGVGVSCGIAAFMFIGIAQYFVREFKGQAILPGDLLALDTAAEVAGGYVYQLTPRILQSVTLSLSAICLCSFVTPSRFAERRDRLVNLGANLATGLVALSIVCNGVSATNFQKAYDIKIDYWDTLSSFRKYGFVPSFVTCVQELSIEEPDGWSEGGAKELQAQYAASYDANRDADEGHAEATAQFEDEKPSIIAVMNETFSDLSMYNGLGVGYEGPTYFKSIPDALVRGDLSVSVNGGGTCNSEFEFLTGTSMAFVGAGKYPYQSYDFSDVDSLPRQLSALGYETTAIHPNDPNNWRRNAVYSQMGFDRFIDRSAFENDPIYHNGRTDRSTYDKVLEQLRSSDEPQFILDVTMQNHSGYTMGNIPEEDLRGYQPPGFDATTTQATNEYLACIDASDRDLAYLIEQLRQLDRPVVLIFFGDHQPNFSPAINDLMFQGEEEPAHAERAYTTQYFVWANYEVSGTTQESRTDDVSASQLAATALDLVGAPLSDYQKASLATRTEMPRVNLLAYQDTAGTWHDPNGENDADYDVNPTRRTYDALAQIAYLNYGDKVN